MSFDIYSTRAQLAALEQMPREYSFLYDTFCADGGVVEDDEAIYDYRKGDQDMAPIVHPGTGGVLMGRTGYETRQIGFCCIAPERIITRQDITGRAFGEDILGAMTPEQRAKKMLARDLTEMRQAIQRRREWMALQVLLNGKLEVFRYTNEGRDKQTTMIADYGFTQNYTPDTKWNESGAKIETDMRNIYDMVYEGLGTVDKIIMSPDVADAMLANSDFLRLHDMLNLNVGEINTRYVGHGVRYLGRNNDGVDMYTFAGRYRDDDGQVKPCLPSGTLIAGSAGMLKAVHGPITQVESTGQDAAPRTYIKREVALRYGSIDGNTVKNRLTSCPTIVPFNVDGWCVAHVL